MKKSIVLILLVSLILSGCGAEAAPETTAPAATVPTTVPVTEAPTTVPPTQEPTEAPTEPPAPTNPFTGETPEAPMETRAFAVTINNVPGAMPLYGVSRADLFFEMFVNDYCTRGLAFFSDIRQVSDIGSVRSLRYNFTDLCRTYDAVVVHVGGSNQVMTHLAGSGVDNVNVSYGGADYYYRDQGRLDAGYAIEHTMMVRGSKTMDFAESKGIRITREEDRDFGLRFAEDATPAGEDANMVTIHLTHGSIVKTTVMKYSAETGKYLFHQYGKDMYDAAEKQNIEFENVIVMLCNVYNDGVYHVAELVGSGEGFFACNGKIIPIKWSHESLDGPILFTLTDGTPLELGVGSSYIAIAPLTSTVEWE